nr:unnamed protein product [Callosobruchus analis]
MLIDKYPNMKVGQNMELKIPDIDRARNWSAEVVKDKEKIKQKEISYLELRDMVIEHFLKISAPPKLNQPKEKNHYPTKGKEKDVAFVLPKKGKSKISCMYKLQRKERAIDRPLRRYRI